MSSTLKELGIILLLILFNGFFAMSEIAIVSSRKSRLEQWSKEGLEGAQAALDLANAPHIFLATIQIGMTVTAILAGVFGGATVGDTVAQMLRTVPGLKPYASALGYGTVVVGISYLTLILGELTPKRMGLANSEKVACVIAPTMLYLATIASPAIALLNASSDFIVKLLGIKQSSEPPVTTEELNLLIEHGTEAGVFQEAEEDMVKAVLRLGNRAVTALMTPRPKLIWLDINDPHEKIAAILVSAPPTRLLVCENDVDHLHGYVFTRHVLAQPALANALDLKMCLKQPLFIPETKTCLQVLEMFKHSGTHIAVVLDEYGSVEGVITMTDLLKAIVGEFDYPEMPLKATLRTNDCCWLLDGFMPLDQVKEMMDVEMLPNEESRKYHTLAGFILNQLEHVPTCGEEFVFRDFRFHVTSMSGRRIEKVGVILISDVDAKSIRQIQEQVTTK